MKVIIFAALVALAAAECPNACSGHGTCGAKDSCSCYQNYQGNDCSERTCYFGIAHVDTPKGDLNADGFVSGPLTTVVTGSEVYPWGTTEQYPNANPNEGHFYMECSNKGICDRKSGQCDCFDGYSGTACARASGPNDCSGHGTCESIKELAEMRSYDTNAHHTVTDVVAGKALDTSSSGCSASEPCTVSDYSELVQESYSYDLWDQDKTMGCKCDPVYYGADCSLKKCKYGVDPLFYDSSDGVIRQTTVVHLGSSGKNSAALAGTYKIVFYDVFGEKYVTKGISAVPGTGASAVKLALQALPNGVITKIGSDETAVSPDAVTVTAQKITATESSSTGLSYEGGIGQGVAGDDGLGLGSNSKGITTALGVEYTITFKTNPGVLKTIELDTRQVANAGNPDYYVANSRQGQFSSRYTTTGGRVQMLRYGSKLMYHNNNVQGGVNANTANPTNTLVKVGGQEVLITAVDSTANMFTLSSAYLGASIEPVTIDTGMTGTALASGSPDSITTDTATLTAIRVATTPINTAIVFNSCPLTVGTGSPAASAAAIQILAGHDCEYASSLGSIPVYRRTDDTNNQNWYRTSADTGALGTEPLVLARGSPYAYHTEDYGNNVATTPATQTVTAYTASTGALTFVGKHPTGTANTAAWVNGIGPLNMPAITANDLNSIPTNVQDFFSKDFTGQTFNYRKEKVATADGGIVSGSVLIISGRRYRVKTRANAKITFTENFAGGGLQRMCSACVTNYKGDGTDVTVSTAAAAPFIGIDVAVGDHFVIGGFVGNDYQVRATSTITAGTGVFTTAPSSQNGAAATIGGLTTDQTGTFALYKVLDNNYIAGNKPIIVTESKDNVNYQYVAQCSNRGTCDSATGLCKCFKGYSHDNCNTQNMLAA
jgi:hypothetical protein